MSRTVTVPRDAIVRRQRLKLLQFHENVRPAYYGTFSRRSRAVSGRRPMGKASELLDYEYDSEEDWEPETEEGDECVSGDDDKEEDDKDGDDNEDEDDRWMVPHGFGPSFFFFSLWSPYPAFSLRLKKVSFIKFYL